MCFMCTGHEAQDYWDCVADESYKETLTKLDRVLSKLDELLTIDGPVCPTCGPTFLERHPTRIDVFRCFNCKEHLARGL